MSNPQVATRIIEQRTPAVGADRVLVQNIGIDMGGMLTAVLGVGMETPCEATQVLSTSADDQRELRFDIYRGNRMMARDNTFLGCFAITAIDARGAGIPQVAVTFAVRDGDILLEVQDADGSMTLQIESARRD